MLNGTVNLILLLMIMLLLRLEACKILELWTCESGG